MCWTSCLRITTSCQLENMKKTLLQSWKESRWRWTVSIT
jgi:hypothetical protein